MLVSLPGFEVSFVIEMMIETASLHDMNIPIAQNEAFIAKINEMARQVLALKYGQ